MEEIKNIFNKKSDTNSLKRNFMAACGNKDFKNYVDSLPIEEDLLMKYTTRLEDSCCEVKNCLKCPGLDNCPNRMKGYYLKPEKQDKIITFSYVTCKKYQKYLEDIKYTENIIYYQMTSEFKDATFKNIYKDDKARMPIIKYFKTFMDDYKANKHPKGLYLTGSFGSGKTYLIASLFNEMAKKNIKSAIVYYPEFLRSLKASFGTDYEEKFNYIKKAPLLLLDDVGAENSTAWARDEVIGPILQYRMEEHLPTFFTSNLTLLEFENNLSNTTNGASVVKARRIIERIKQLTETLELISKNRRD